MKLSVVIATFNEEENIEKCLEAVKDIADEVIVVDGGSTDKTVEIVKKFQAKITITDNPAIFHINKQKGLDLAKGDWILQLDADEIVTSELAEEIKNTATKSSKYSAYFLKRKNYFLWTFLKKGGQYPDPVIRLFQRGAGSFPCKSVHEQIEIIGNTGILNNDLLHYTAPTLCRYLTNSNRYTSLTAREFQQNKVGTNFRSKFKYLAFEPLVVFLKLFFRHKGFGDGFAGFIFAFYSGLHVYTSYVKYYEAEKNNKKL